jgi:hypothetical protein
MVVNGNVPPRRLKNAARRPREYLTPAEVEQLIAAATARTGRHGHRDATMILRQAAGDAVLSKSDGNPVIRNGS